MASKHHEFFGQVRHAPFDNASNDGSHTVVAGVANCRIVIVSLVLTCDDETTIQFLDATPDAPNDLSGPLPLKSGVALPHNPHGWFEPTAVGTGLVIAVDDAVQVGGGVNYLVEPQGDSTP